MSGRMENGVAARSIPLWTGMDWTGGKNRSHGNETIYQERQRLCVCKLRERGTAARLQLPEPLSVLSVLAPRGRESGRPCGGLRGDTGSDPCRSGSEKGVCDHASVPEVRCAPPEQSRRRRRSGAADSAHRRGGMMLRDLSRALCFRLAVTLLRGRYEDALASSTAPRGLHVLAVRLFTTCSRLISFALL